jgi:hypothetical protein
MILLKKHKILSALMVVFTLGFAFLACGQQMGYFPFNGNTFKIRSGGTQSVQSGGIVDFETGSYLKINSTAVTASAAELNLIDGSTAGTSVASKALVLGTTKNTDSLTIAALTATGITLGSTAITASGTEINKLASVTAGTTTASKALVVGTSRNVNYIAVGDTLLGDSAMIRLNSGSTLQVDSGASLTINGSISMGIQQILADSTLTSATSGKLYYARPVAAKTTATLPAAAAGLNYEFYVVDTDSLRIKVATGDSILDSSGAAYVTTTSVAGTVKLISLDGVYWVMQHTLGTWTSY